MLCEIYHQAMNFLIQTTFWNHWDKRRYRIYLIHSAQAWIAEIRPGAPLLRQDKRRNGANQARPNRSRIVARISKRGNTIGHTKLVEVVWSAAFVSRPVAGQLSADQGPQEAPLRCNPRSQTRRQVLPSDRWRQLVKLSPHAGNRFAIARIGHTLSAARTALLSDQDLDRTDILSEWPSIINVPLGSGLLLGIRA